MNRIGESTLSKVLVFHLKMLGLWTPENFSTFYFVYSSLLYVFLSIIYVFCMVMNIFFISDVKETIHSLYMTLTCVALLFKTLNFLWYIRRMQQMLKTVNDFVLQNDNEASLVKSRFRAFRNFWIVYYFMINGTCAAAHISALYTTPRQLPFRAWYPFDWRHSEKLYWIAYAYQVVGMTVQSNLNICIEIFPGFLMYMAHLKMEILSLRLEGNRPDLKKQQKSVRHLVDSIKLHQHIVKFIRKIEVNFSVAFFAQFSLSGIVICCVTYGLTTTSPKESATEFSFYSFFATALITQIFLPCFLGNEIIYASDDLMNSAYNSSWEMLLSNDHGKLLVILMARLNRASRIVVGKLFVLSLDTFTSIIYFAYRLYAVLTSSSRLA